MSVRRRVSIAVLLIPLTLATAFYLPGIFFKYFFADGGLYAAVSLRMARTGEWWTPMQSNVTYFNKPPLNFWIRALFVKLFGEADWVLRLPDLLSALACVVLTTSIVKRLHGPRAALIAGVLLALTSEFIWRISRLRLDFMHTAFMLAALRLIVQGATTRRASRVVVEGLPPVPSGRTWITLSGLPIGLALLVKPMFGLLMLLIAGLWLLFARPALRRKVVWLIPAVLLALAVAAPWHLGMAAIHGHQFTDRLFMHESIARATGDEFVREPWWWYFRYFLDANESPRRFRVSRVAMLYWPVLVCVLLAAGWWLRGRKLVARTRFRGGLLAQFYAFGFFTLLCAFGDKKSWYLISVLPAFAWVASLWIATVTPHVVLRWFTRLAAPASLLMLAVTLIFGLSFDRPMKPPPDTQTIQQFIRNHPDAEFWNVNLSRYYSAPMYIHTNIWPMLIEDVNTGQRWEPSRDSYLLYDRESDHPVQPDPADPVIIEAGRFIMVQHRSEKPIARPIVP